MDFQIDKDSLRKISGAKNCVVVTGAGGAFCAGGDVKGMASGGDAGSGARSATLDERIHNQRLNQRNTAGRIYEMPKPVIGSLPGAAAGAGLALALACDLRIASEKAILTTAFARVGFSGDYGGTFFLTQLVGASKARELYYLSDRIDAKQAEQLGLVNRLVPESALEEQTLELARRLASGPTVAYRYMKENISRAASGGSLGECLDLEATHHVFDRICQLGQPVGHFFPTLGGDSVPSLNRRSELRFFDRLCQPGQPV